MKLAIIGAGEGSRLKSEGISVPKPLIKVGGIPLIERIIRIAVTNGVSSAHLIINPEFSEVKDYLKSVEFGIPLDCQLLAIPSSMHTLFALAASVTDEPFLLSTVDSVFREDEFRGFVSFIRSAVNVDGVLAITNYIDDEKPLCVSLGDNDNITEFMDSSANSDWATGGIYYFTPTIFREIPRALEQGVSRLRNFLRLLLRQGYTLKAYRFSKIIDVDHAADIRAAEEFINARY